MNTTIPTLLVVLLVTTTWASPLVCPYSTSGGLIFLKLILDFDIGNASCSPDQLLEVFQNFQNVLKLENSNISDHSTALIKGALCGAGTNITNRRLLIQTYGWSGTAKCRLCTPDNKDRRRMDDLNLTQEISYVMTESQSEGLIENFITQPGSCLYQQWDASVRVNITESSTERLQLSCD